MSMTGRKLLSNIRIEEQIEVVYTFKSKRNAGGEKILPELKRWSDLGVPCVKGRGME